MSSGGRPLAGEVVVFTGFRDGALARRVAALGGVYKDGLSKAVTTVVCKDAETLGTNKARAARERGLRVLTRDEFSAAPAASGGAVDFADPSLLAAAGLPPPGLSAAATRAHGIRVLPAAPVSHGAAPAPAPAPLELGASRLGGAPDLPPGHAWPRVGSQPMLHLATLDLSRASLLDGSGVLPKHGWLVFFAAADYVGELGASGSARGGVGAGFGDTPADMAAALRAADAGPSSCALAPSRVLFVGPTARLQRVPWPPDLPPHLRLAECAVQFQAGEAPQPHLQAGEARARECDAPQPQPLEAAAAATRW